MGCCCFTWECFKTDSIMCVCMCPQVHIVIFSSLMDKPLSNTSQLNWYYGYTNMVCFEDQYLIIIIMFCQCCTLHPWHIFFLFHMYLQLFQKEVTDKVIDSLNDGVVTPTLFRVCMYVIHHCVCTHVRMQWVSLCHWQCF